MVPTLGVGEPDHVPATDVRVDPTRAVPDTVGDVVFEGAVPTAVGAAVNSVELTPAREPVTRTERNLPACETAGVNVVDVTAGDMAAHDGGSATVATGTADEHTNQL